MPHITAMVYLEKFRLDGRRAFVTGGGRGIGLCAAEAFAEAGAAVIVSDHDPAILESGRAELARKGYVVEGVVLDVTDAERVTATADRLNELGPVDILFANAGIAWPDTAAEVMTDDVWRRMIDVDLNGVFWSCRAFGAHMLRHGRGSIVTTGSMSAIVSNRPQRQVHYNAAKAAVHHLTHSLAGEWAPRGVRVNAIAPGYIDTAISGPALREPGPRDVWLENTPMHRAGTPEEIATIALFLASDAASFVTGAVVVADGGYTVW